MGWSAAMQRFGAKKIAATFLSISISRTSLSSSLAKPELFNARLRKTDGWSGPRHVGHRGQRSRWWDSPATGGAGAPSYRQEATAMKGHGFQAGPFLPTARSRAIPSAQSVGKSLIARQRRWTHDELSIVSGFFKPYHTHSSGRQGHGAGSTSPLHRGRRGFSGRPHNCHSNQLKKTVW
jgi:hypothetical protein